MTLLLRRLAGLGRLLGASLGLLLLVAGVPLGLVFGVGFPRSLPSWSDIVNQLQTQGIPTAALLYLLALVCWVLWAYLIWCLVTEAVSLVRRSSGRHRAITGPGRLLAGALLASLFVGVQLMSSEPSHPRRSHHSPPGSPPGPLSLLCTTPRLPHPPRWVPARRSSLAHPPPGGPGGPGPARRFPLGDCRPGVRQSPGVARHLGRQPRADRGQRAALHRPQHHRPRVGARGPESVASRPDRAARGDARVRLRGHIACGVVTARAQHGAAGGSPARRFPVGHLRSGVREPPGVASHLGGGPGPDRGQRADLHRPQPDRPGLGARRPRAGSSEHHTVRTCNGTTANTSPGRSARVRRRPHDIGVALPSLAPSLAPVAPSVPAGGAPASSPYQCTSPDRSHPGRAGAGICRLVGGHPRRGRRAGRHHRRGARGLLLAAQRYERGAGVPVTREVRGSRCWPVAPAWPGSVRRWPPRPPARRTARCHPRR